MAAIHVAGVRGDPCGAVQRTFTGQAYAAENPRTAKIPISVTVHPRSQSSET